MVEKEGAAQATRQPHEIPSKRLAPVNSMVKAQGTALWFLISYKNKI